MFRCIENARRPKSWEEFSQSQAPSFDFVFTVCGNAANETCPVWTGRPLQAHWGIPDPAAVQGSQAQQTQASADAFLSLSRRIRQFVDLPFAALDTHSLQQKLRDIGAARDA